MLRRLDPAARLSRDPSALDRALRESLRGEARFDDGHRALFATDASNYRQLPIGVVFPRDVEDAVRAVEICRAFDAPIVSRGGGTSLAGQCCNAAVVLDFSRHVRGLLEIDAGRRTARVEPGLVLDDLRKEAEKEELTFAPDPATHTHCTLGGMIGNNSCGIHSVMGGRTSDNVEALDVLTYDGLRMRAADLPEGDGAPEGRSEAAIHGALRALRDRHAEEIRRRYPDIPRRVSGYNLDELLPEKGGRVARALVGTEGTCVVVLGATLRLVPSPRGRALLVLGYPDVAAAGDDIPELMRHQPIGLEGLDHVLFEDIRKKGLPLPVTEVLPDGRAWLLMEFGGRSREEAKDRARAAVDVLGRRARPPSHELYDDPAEAHKVWQIRESGLGATARVPGQADTWPGWEDSAVHPERLGDYLRALRTLYDKYGYDAALYGHFGQGCVHTRIDFDLRTAAGIARYRAFVEEASDTVVRFGGSLSGEHGDGQARGELLSKMYGRDLVDAFRRFKSIWDPEGRMNPGKVVDAYPLDDHLRLGADYNPRAVETRFAYPEDAGSFARATERCVGVGKCRRMDGGVMCPSWRATRDEQHTTRGRAHLLFEMLRGEPLRLWKDERVKEALDLCLACKGCKSDCPVNVDLATYKAEFFHHYYKGRLRPRHAYAFGLIPLWARAAALAPGLANVFTQTPGLRAIARAAAGVSPHRAIPRFAPRTFREIARSRPPANAGRPAVILWADTFTNHFEPWIAEAAADVLEALRYRVVVPRRPLCCGRPLYDYGMLDRAVAWLKRILASLRDPIRAGVPVVGLEPSCVSVFRDELTELLPHDEDARRLRALAMTLAEFVGSRAPDREWPSLDRRVLVQPHCHDHAVLDTAAEGTLLGRLGLDVVHPDAGCCGMAGAFGFEKEKYGVSQACAEHKLFPAIREEGADTWLVADGFSCREQIRQGLGRRALHLAEVLRASLEKGGRRG